MSNWISTAAQFTHSTDSTCNETAVNFEHMRLPCYSPEKLEYKNIKWPFTKQSNCLPRQDFWQAAIRQGLKMASSVLPGNHKDNKLLQRKSQ